MKRVTTYIYRNRSFEIVKANPCKDGFANAEQFPETANKDVYLAIEDKYIGSDGRLNTRLCLAQMFSSETIDQCMGRVNQQVDIDVYMSEGLDFVSAYIKVNPDLKPMENELRKFHERHGA